MMSKTHLAIGVASSMAIIRPKNSEECICSIVAGLLGGIVSDVDILDNDYKSDALLGQITALLLSAILLFVDYSFNVGIINSIINKSKITTIIGIVLYLLLCIRGFKTSHRTFTHSLLALALFTLSIYLICPLLTRGYFIGFSSHLLLDLLNKRDLKLFYPAKAGICFHLCSAKGLPNTVFMFIGLVITAIMLVNCFIFTFI